ncbi:polynucleotide kinase-phosphatase [Acidipropionibacterium acidipropionici]|uniref:polynucleotide kinase-phosphatase n=1 Tax=Acidipropionibacterium acidipropionici TaxID=1748 RepID=UPI000408A4A2|nr:polynucleotide kinase-phosphatase [Acidipropionibacterium acidipropionici]ALN16011.1 polynucleotide kinase-phosphatase [Acidipropionibacterium acidipropionici]APZ08239.1 polynucleotide kinase-phosphatase [Acidipropionibacterium acidipropionici]
MSEIHIPELSLVVLIGISGSGKSTFAERAFGPFEAVSSDHCRGLVSGDTTDQAATADAFDLLYYLVGKRLDRGLLTVVDATNVTRQARAGLVRLARDHDVLPAAIVLDVGTEVAVARNAARPDRSFGAGVVRRQAADLRQSIRRLKKEGFRSVHVLHGVEEIQDATIVRDRLLTDRRDDHGPFDIIGDVHGCLDELLALLAELGYNVVTDGDGLAVDAVHPEGRRVVFVGDLVDRGPDTVGVLRLAMGMTSAGHALALPGNHEDELARALDGRKVQIGHGLETTLAELSAQPEAFRSRVHDWCRGLVSHLILDGGGLVVAHAGLKEAYQGRASGRVRAFALYGDTTGQSDEYGLPVRLDWAQQYRGSALVAYGHTPVPRLEWVNNTICLDTGCVFGGRLSALRYPERTTVQVDATAVHSEPARPFTISDPVPRGDDELRLDDVVGRHVVETGTLGRVSVTAENAAGALEVLSRYAIAPRLMSYLPPTMSPVATSHRPDYLEHPDEAFSTFAEQGVGEVICEEKHMGSRAVIHLPPDDGAVYTRTGRSFFAPELTATLLERIRAAASAAGLDAELGDRLLLDAELLPWSVKAGPLLREHFAPVGAAARLALPAEVRALEGAAGRGMDVGPLLERTRSRLQDTQGYDRAWQRHAWPTDGLEGVQLAIFQVLAADGASFADRDHTWHLGIADRLVDADPALFRTTRRLVVDTSNEESRDAGARWWLELTAGGGEGMVVKPLGNLVRTRKGRLVQPGLKVRGREYLRIIYGPDYTEPGNLSRLRDRNLGRKRSLALREYALGLEAVDRLVAGEPLWRVHEAVAAVLALESEPVDPRL